MKYNRVLTIAGSDSGGGAGIQADIKAISANGCFAASAITAITAQNTVGVTDIHPIPNETLRKQIQAVLEDIGADAIKIGMLHSTETIRTVIETLKPFGIKSLVIDPVMVATSGDRLLLDDAIDTLKNELIPLARIITPNIPEAEILIGRNLRDQSELADAAKELGEKSGVSVLLKAGHLTEDVLTDILYDFETKETSVLESKRVNSKNTHGTGCTMSSALAAHLAKGARLKEAVEAAKDYINHAIIEGADYEIGQGHGPVHHFYNCWK